MRPRPPEALMEDYPYWYIPDQRIFDFVKVQFLDEKSPLFNPDHAHLAEATVGFIWTNQPNTSKGMFILGAAEQPIFRCGKWQKGRQEQQITEWFGTIPDFLITLNAHYCMECNDTDFMMLLEHELYHCAQAIDNYGMPKFNRDTGMPDFTIRGHDVEEFIGVVARYGTGHPDGNLAKLVSASRGTPLIDGRTIAQCCGTCLA